VPAAGRPFGFEADRWKINPSEASRPANEAPPPWPFLVDGVLFLVDGRPGGLPRRVVRCVDDVPRLVFAYCRVFFFVFCLRRRVLAVSVISLGL
jgi:hypothetical protein